MTAISLKQPVTARNDIIRFEGIVKHFGGAQALAGASLIVRRGTIHGLVGQNGAGKSTLIKLLAGLHQPDGGRIEIEGRTFDRLTPHLAEELGIHFIHQDRLLVPTFTVGEALFLGREPRISGTPFLDRRLMQRRASDILNDYFGIRLPNSALIGELSTAEKQIVQITRALLNQPKVLVFDEPTAALVRREADILFRLIRRLRDEGVTIIYISHYLNEIEELCDHVTVLRNGLDVASLPIGDTSAGAIARLMVERDIKEMFPKPQVTPGEEILKVEQLSAPGKYSDVSFTLRRGEVLGLTGLLGSGAKELVRALFGLETAASGRIEVSGKAARFTNPTQATGREIALVPEDRRRHGIALDLSVAENISLSSLGRFTRFGFLDRKRERDEADALISRLQVKTNGRDALLRTLSGGNQQKIAIAKWLSRRSEVYLLDEPTVGVDIGSKVEIYTLIGELAARGAGVIVLSSDLPELVGITDRILVLFRGRVVREFISSETTADAVLAQSTGSSEDNAMSAEVEFAPSGLSAAEPPPRPAGNIAAAALRFGSLIAFAAILIVFSLTAPYFLSIGNIGNVLGQSAISGVLAIGLTIVLIAGGSNVVTGGIDLSLAANMGLSAAVYASLTQLGYGDATAIAAAILTGALIGTVNAIAVVYAGIVPLLATLAVMNVVAGLELVLTGNTVLPASTPFLSALSASDPFGIPVLAYVLLGFTAIATAIVQYTPLGLRLYAVGEFPDAARAAGLPLRRLLSGAFVASGLSGGIAGILSVSYLSGSTTGSGEMLLPVVVTALLGSVFSRRLVPTVTGTLLSALLVGFLVNGFQLLNISSTLVSGVQGVLILIVVSATTLLRRQEV
ncbi:ABC-type sugar transport system ATPase subunit/ribose/xylose/arabinose/galactoside ABC-type transport system permease subunit [Rhizobium sp. BK226]|nr:ABC-type sugar transport system ATPase subunit/ribose/xylose/arabinose/galactoside ABC-type transport system permease subunit [Rhizobium sp. BK226]